VAPPSGNLPSFLLVDEYFSQQDDRFLTVLRQPYPAKQLAAFADRWKKDSRPWARRQIMAYLGLPLDVPGHHPVVKRLFKHAEQAGDHELVGVFLRIFDRLVRRYRKVVRHWDYDPATRRSTVTENYVIALAKDVLPADSANPVAARNPRTGALIEAPRRGKAGARLFYTATRRYLRRRAWRYFRFLAFRSPADYLREISLALARYEDADLKRGEDLLESWGLMNACFRRHDALKFRAHGVQIRAGRKLSELSAAPFRPQLWEDAAAAEHLLHCVLHARARTVRVWAIQLLQRHHLAWLAQSPPESITALLDHADDAVQEFAARMLPLLEGAARWPVDTWLRLLETKSPTALSLICEALQRNVQGSRLDLGQCVALATAAATPVARLGLEFLRGRKIATAAERALLAGLGQARCAALGAEIAQWALGQVGSAETYDRDVVLALLDSLLAELRAAAWNWLQAGPPIPDDPVLWSRLVETPFDDLRLAIVAHLARKASLPGATSRDLAPVWSAVLVGVHRGGRQKPKAMGQIVHAIETRPELADELLPVLAVAIRSIRRPEARAGLAAVVQLAEARPELAAAIGRCIPELSLTPAG
jgi:hypothetical protein